ncbi:MAG: GNAT family N-acetyltransferase [Alphaproteobacteria bacterium]|nr:GNAT family N-acetyltransferase [Alphaproteobacteria bacterium]
MTDREEKARAAAAFARARAVLIDVDGVLVAGGVAIPGAAEFLAALGARAFIVSNNSTDTPAAMTAKFARQGLVVAPERLSLAGAVMVDTLAAEAPGQRVCLVAAESLAAYARAAGLDLRDDAPTVALARDTGLTYARLHHAARLVHGGARLVVANPDLTHPDVDGGPVPETGALLAALLACAPAARPEIVGKPEARLFAAAMARAGVGPEAALMIGDNPATDGAGARALGIETILVGPRGTFAGVADLVAFAASSLTVARETPVQDAVRALIRDADAFSQSLYEADASYLMEVDAMCGPEVRFLVARWDGRAVGCGALLLGPDGDAEIKRIYVDPASRGRGVAGAVMRGLEDAARRAGVARLLLETGPYSTDALALYRRFGYRERGRFGSYPDHPLSVFMEKVL